MKAASATACARLGIAQMEAMGQSVRAHQFWRDAVRAHAGELADAMRAVEGDAVARIVEQIAEDWLARAADEMPPRDLMLVKVQPGIHGAN